MSDVSAEEIMQARLKIMQSRINDLQNENNHFLKIIDERDAMINLMKCCANCRKFYDKSVKDCKCINFNKWEIMTNG